MARPRILLADDHQMLLDAFKICSSRSSMWSAR